MSLKLLCVGDIHLGRVPSHIPKSLGDEWNVNLAAARPSAVWRQIVQQACDLQVAAVLLAGDVVDRENRQYEALGPLEAGVGQLLKHGIRVLGVAGNHDVETLPRLADQLPGFELLGRGGQWQVASLAEGVRLVGWSFPGPGVLESPLAHFHTVREELRSGDGPVIGLLHCDLDQPGSRNAPVRAAELQDPEVTAWLLGHIHKPSPLNGQARPVGYLGSLVPLDPTETGPRGPWLCEIDRGSVRLQHLPCAPLRWETCSVDVGGLSDLNDLLPRLTEGINTLHRSLDGSLDGVRMVGCRVALRGCTPLRQALRTQIESIRLADLITHREDVYYFVDRVDENAVTSPLPLTEIATGASYPALLARRLLLLHNNDPSVEPLITRAVMHLQAKADTSPWNLAGSLTVDRTAARDYLLRTGLDALEELLSQQPASYRALLAQN